MVMAAETTIKRPREQVLAITFNQSDLEDVNYPHIDSLIVTLNINGNQVKWIIIDTGNSADLLYY